MSRPILAVLLLIAAAVFGWLVYCADVSVGPNPGSSGSSSKTPFLRGAGKRAEKAHSDDIAVSLLDSVTLEPVQSRVHAQYESAGETCHAHAEGGKPLRLLQARQARNVCIRARGYMPKELVGPVLESEEVRLIPARSLSVHVRDRHGAPVVGAQVDVRQAPTVDRRGQLVAVPEVLAAHTSGAGEVDLEIGAWTPVYVAVSAEGYVGTERCLVHGESPLVVVLHRGVGVYVATEDLPPTSELLGVRMSGRRGYAFRGTRSLGALISMGREAYMTTVPVDTYEIECVWRKRVVLSETRVFREGGRHVLDLTLPERSSTGRVPRRFLIRAHAGAAEPVTVEVRSRSESLGRYLSRITANEEADVILPVDVSVVSIRAPGFAAATCNVVVDGVTVADLVPRQGHETRLRVPLPVPAAAISLRVLRPSEARTGPQTLSVDPQTGLTLESINLPLGPCEIEYRVGPHLVVEWIRVVEGQPTGLRGRGRIVLHAPPDITPQDRLVVFTTSGSGWTARSLREISWPSSLPSVSLDLAAGPYALFIYEGASVRPMDITCRPFQVAAAHLDQNPAFAAPRLKVCRDDGPDWVELHPISVMPSVRARAVRRIEEHGVVDVHDLLPGPYWYSIGARRGVVTLQAGHEALIGDEGALEVVVDGVPGERLRAYFRSGSLVRSSEGRRESPGRFGLRIEPGELLLSAAVSDWAVYTWGNSNANNSFPGVKWVRLPEELVESSWTRVELVELEGQPVLPWLGWEPVLHESSSHPRQLPMVARSMRVRVRNSTHGGHVTYLVTLPGGVPESESWVGRSPR